LFQDIYPDPTTNPQLRTLLRNEIHYSPMLQFLLGAFGDSYGPQMISL